MSEERSATAATLGEMVWCHHACVTGHVNSIPVYTVVFATLE